MYLNRQLVTHLMAPLQVVVWFLAAGAYAAPAVTPTPAATTTAKPGPEGADATYIGWRGAEIPLKFATDRIGVTFEPGVGPDDIRKVLFSDPSLDAAKVDVSMKFSALQHSQIYLVSTSAKSSRDDVKRMVGSLRHQPGVMTVNPVVYPGQDVQRPSVLTNFLYVNISTATPEKEVLALFEADGLEVYERTDYSDIGVIGFRLKLSEKTGAKTTTGGANTLEIAKRYRNHPLMLEAVPTFAPLYQDQSSIRPTDYLYGWNGSALVTGRYEPADETASYTAIQCGQWNLERINAPGAWDIVYGGSFNNTATAPRIVIAALDDGVMLDYAQTTFRIGATDYTPGTALSLTPNTLWIPQPNMNENLLGHLDLVKLGANGVNGIVRSNQWVNEDEIIAASPNGGNNSNPDADGNHYVHDYFGWDFAGNDITTDAGDQIPFPDYNSNSVLQGLRGHGNGAASISAAMANNNVAATEGIAGVCPSALIMPLRFHNTIGSTNGLGDLDVYYCSHAEAAINYAATNGHRPASSASAALKGAQVLQLVMNVNLYDPGVHNAIRRAHYNGSIIVGSAGNWGNFSVGDLDAVPGYPNVFPEVMNVGASSYASYPNETKTSYSSYGWAVDVVAPSGDNGTPGILEVSSARITDWDIEHKTPNPTLDSATEQYKRYTAGRGTSSAYPQAAGLAALVLTANPNLSAGEVEAAIQFAAADLKDSDGTCGPAGLGGRDRYTGWGRIDAEKAIQLAQKRRFSIRNAKGVTVASWDADGRFVLDGDVKENCASSDLVPRDGQLIQGTSNYYPNDSEFIVTYGTTVVARLDTTATIPSDASNPGSFIPPTLYLAGAIQTIWSEPQSTTSEFIIQNSSGSAVAYIDHSGNLFVKPVTYTDCNNSSSQRQEIFITSRAHSRRLFTVGPGGTSAGYNYSTIQAAINDTTNVPEYSIVEVYEGTYGPISFGGRNLEIRSRYLLDPTKVSSTFIVGDGTNGGHVVTFSGAESKDCSIQGFTIKDGNATATSGRAACGGGVLGSAGGATSTKAAILNNVFLNNKAYNSNGTYSGNGGAIAYCDGLIEGNQIGQSGSPNKAANGGAIAFCNGDIRRNKIVRNTATADGGALYQCQASIVDASINESCPYDANATLTPIYAVIRQNYIAHNSAQRGGAMANCGVTTANGSGTIQSNILYGNDASVNGGGLYACNNGAIENNTIYANTAPSGAYGGIYQCSTATNKLRNNILWANTPNQIDSGSTLPRYCCIQSWTGGGVGNIAPADSNPAGNGPKFLSVSESDSWESFLHLNQSTSSCVDAGETDSTVETACNASVLIQKFDFDHTGWACRRKQWGRRTDRYWRRRKPDSITNRFW